MQNLNKSKEQLSSVEERARAANLELQRAHMDLQAKSGECRSLEEQVGNGVECLGRGPGAYYLRGG